MTEKYTQHLEVQLINEASVDGISRLVVGAVILQIQNNEKHILVLTRLPDEFMGGIEELPSGKVEQKESLINALKREIYEETGLELDNNINYIFSFDYLSSKGKKTRHFTFLCHTNYTKIKINPHEHSDFRWLPISGIKNSNLTDNVKELILLHIEP